MSEVTVTKEQVEKLFTELNGLKDFIAKGDESVADRNEARVVELEGKLTEALAHNEEFKTQFKSQIERSEELEKRVKWFEDTFQKSKKSIAVGDGFEEEKDKFSILKAMYAINTGDWKEAQFEKEIFEITAKAQEHDTNSAGGYLIPTEVSQDIIELLRPESILISLGSSVLSGLTGGVWEVPAGKGGIVTYWVKEGVALTESEESFGQVALRPKEVGALVTMNLKFAKRARPDAETYIRGRMAQELALAIDKAGFIGSGGDAQPLGLNNNANVPTHTLDSGGGNGRDFKLEDMVNVEGVLEDKDALRGNLSLAMHPKIKRVLKKSRIPQFSGDTDGDYVFRGFTDSALAEFLGQPFQTTTQIPTNLTVGSSNDISPIFFANWADLLIGQWGNFEIAVATQAGNIFEKRQMMMRITQEVDVAVARPDSFVIVDDARTNNA